MTKNASTGLRRALAGLVAVTLAAGPGIQTAYGALTELSDLPIASKVTAKPNILYTLDDSGSMNLNYLPVFVVNSYYRNGTGTATCAASRISREAGCSGNFYGPPFLAADLNHLTYNPNVTYQAPIKADGTSYPDQNAATTTNWTKVQSDPYLTPGVTVSLTPHGRGAGVLQFRLAAHHDRGQRQRRVSGRDRCGLPHQRHQYDAAGNGAPAITDDYNYPWQLTVAPAGAQYFYAATAVGGVPHHGAGAAKTLWCNTASAGWPKNPVIAGCVGGTITYNTAQQTCNAPVAQCNPTASLRNYNQGAQCRDTVGTADLFCAPNTGGSDGNPPTVVWTGVVPECSACTCKSDYTPPSGKCSITTAACTGPYSILNGDPGQCPVQNTTIHDCGAGTPIYNACAPAQRRASAADCSTARSPAARPCKTTPTSSMAARERPAGTTTRTTPAWAGRLRRPLITRRYPLDANFRTQVNERVSRASEHGEHSASLLHDRVGSVLHRGERGQQRAVEGLRHRRVPKQE